MLIFYCHNYASFCLCCQWYHILTKLFPFTLSFPKSCWCIFFLFALFLVFLRPRNCYLKSTGWFFFFLVYCLPSQGYLLICCRGRRQNTYFWRRKLCFFWNHVLFPLAWVRFFFFLFDWVVTFFHYWVFWFLFFSANSLELYYSLVHFQIPPVEIQRTFEQPVLLLPWHDCDIINTACQSKKRAKRNRQQEKSLQIFRCVPHREHELTKH